MNDLTDQQLLHDYVEHRSDSAFGELVHRHVDLVHSAALRMVGDTHTAQDVSQQVFLALAGNARQLTAHPALEGWLHSTTRNLAAKVVRTDIRRSAREQEAAVMNEILSTNPGISWAHITPHLDEALGELSERERDALLLRYFKNRDLRAVGAAFGISEDAAQKRVSRAVEHLRELLERRGVSIGAGGLTVALAANAVQAAPVGLAAAISTAAVTGTALSTSTLFTATTKTIAMTTLQKIAVTTALIVLAGAGIYEARQAAQLREQNNTLQLAQAPLADRVQQLQKERDDATNRLTALANELARIKKNPSEVLKLRSEVGSLRQQNKIEGEKSALSKVTADPASRAALRTQQKMSIGLTYKDFATQMKLSPEMTGKLNDLLADNIMANIDLVTQALHDGKPQAEVEQIFSAADSAFQGKLQALLGDDGLAQYKNYTQNLNSVGTAKGFADSLTGDTATKDGKQAQLQQLIGQETAAALKNAGLPADYQVIPMLHFANIASEDEANQSLNLLNDIYARVATNSNSFLTADEISSFQHFSTNLVGNLRMILSMNRQLMAPISK